MPMLTMLRIGLPVWPRHAPLAYAIGEIGHAVEHRMDLGHNVLAIDQDRLPSRRAQRDVQDGPLFGNVDLLAGEHRIDPRAEPGLLGQFQQQSQRFVGNAVLRVVEVESGCLDRQALAALGVLSKELAQMQAVDLLKMGRQAFQAGSSVTDFVAVAIHRSC